MKLIYFSYVKKVCKTLLLFFVAFLLSCNNIYLEPKFKVNKDSVYNSIENIIATERISFEGHKIPIDNIIDSSLTIQLINSKNLPLDDESLLNIQEKVASKVKSLLVKEHQFKDYDVIFIRSDTIKAWIGTEIKTEGGFNHRFYERDL